MFFKKSKKINIQRNLTIDIEPEYWVTSYIPSHKLIDMDERLCSILEYKKEELIMKDFRPLMLSELMQTYLNQVYNTKLTFLKLKNVIKEITKLRYMSFRTKNGKIIWLTNIHPIITVNTDNTILTNPFIVKVFFNIDTTCSIAPNIPKEFLDNMTNSPTFCVKHYENNIIIMMDVANSSEISTRKTPKEIALMFHEVIKKSSTMVDYEFYPFIRFIEACGDSLLFIHCPELSLSLKQIHSECIFFALKLTSNLNKILKRYNTHIRCGMVAGECAGGVWDGKTFRLSGENINLSARLEGMCKKEHIVISDSFYNELIKEKYEFKTSLEEEYSELKGLGYHKYYHVNLNDTSIKKEAQERLSIKE